MSHSPQGHRESDMTDATPMRVQLFHSLHLTKPQLPTNPPSSLRGSVPENNLLEQVLCSGAGV